MGTLCGYELLRQIRVLGMKNRDVEVANAPPHTVGIIMQILNQGALRQCGGEQ